MDLERMGRKGLGWGGRLIVLDISAHLKSIYAVKIGLRFMCSKLQIYWFV